MVKIKPKIYAEALYVMCQDKTNLDGVLANFIKVLASHNALSKIEEIIKCFSRLYDLKTNTIEVTVDTAKELDEPVNKEIIKVIKEITKAEKVDMKVVVKPELLGGLVLNFADWQIDASLKRKLQDIKNNIIN